MHGGDVPRILGHVTFPLVKPALLGSLILVIVLMTEEFPVPMILGAPVGIETLSVRIYRLVGRSLPNQASAASIVLTAIVCVLVYTQHRILQGRDYRTVTGKGAQVRPVALGRLRWVAVAFVATYAFIAIVLPLFALLQSALRNNLYVPDATALFDVSQFSLRHLAAALESPAVHQGLINSLVAGVLAASFGSAFFFILAYVVNRTDLPGRRLLEYLVMLPVAKGGLDVHGGGPGGRVKVRVCGSHRGGPVVAGLSGAVAGVAGPQRRAPAALVLGDGAAWIRTWFEGLGISFKVMVLCWWHLRKRCYEQMSSAGGSKDRRRTSREGAVGSVVGREGGCGDRTLERGVGVGEEPCGGRGTDRVSGEAESVHPRLPAAAKGCQDLNFLHEIGNSQLQLMQPEAASFVARREPQTRPQI